MAGKAEVMKDNPEVEAPDASPSRIGWIVGWVVAPSVILGSLFLGGVFVGANMPELWMTRAVMWLFG